MGVERVAPIYLASLPVVPATLPSFGPPAVIIFGAEIPIIPMVLSLLGLWLARMVTLAKDRKHEEGERQTWVVTLLLTVCLVALVIELKPGPGTGLIYGVGFGGTGLLVIEGVIRLFRHRAPRVFEALLGSPPPVGSSRRRTYAQEDNEE